MCPVGNHTQLAVIQAGGLFKYTQMYPVGNHTQFTVTQAGGLFKYTQMCPVGNRTFLSLPRKAQLPIGNRQNLHILNPNPPIHQLTN
jgi:hypothetical protein